MSIEWGNIDFWIAAGTIGLLFATLLLAWIGWYQIGQIRRETKKWRSLDACDLYDRDPILHSCLKQMRAYKLSKRSGSKFDSDIKTEVVSVLNYLDGVAIGIDQGLYLESIVKDHLGDIIFSHVRDHLNSDDAKLIFGVSPASYPHLISVHDRWVSEAKKPPLTSFKDKS